jgi:uncharacterized protein (DUF58 family)
MLTKRGWAAVGAGIGLWIGSRFVGSPDLHMVAVGVLILPLAAILLVRWSRVSVSTQRHLSHVRVSPGTRVIVTVRVENRARISLPFLLLEDALPASLGRPARLVLAGIPSMNAQDATYTVSCRQRGRYTIGPLTVFFSDPFGLARVPLTSDAVNELVVCPEVEDLQPWKLGMQGAGAGDSSARRLHRSAAEFYTMREYVQGDDLRRIHWPSVARTGHLMIRQDEATRRSAATLFLDNRSGMLGINASPGFERAVSVSASLGRMLVRNGFALRYAALDMAPVALSEERLLELLADASPTRTRGLGDSLTRLRATSRPDSSLAFVSGVPLGTELAAILRAGAVFGPKLGVFVYPVDPSSLPEEAATELENRASVARISLLRAGWEVFIVRPDGRLTDVWQPRRVPLRLQAVGSPF